MYMEWPSEISFFRVSKLVTEILNFDSTLVQVR